MRTYYESKGTSLFSQIRGYSPDMRLIKVIVFGYNPLEASMRSSKRSLCARVSERTTASLRLAFGSIIRTCRSLYGMASRSCPSLQRSAVVRGRAAPARKPSSQPAELGWDLAVCCALTAAVGPDSLPRFLSYP